jgi:branched-chain amino acid transport system permease protein
MGDPVKRSTVVAATIFVAVGILIAFLGSVLPSYRLDTGSKVGIYFIAILSLNLVLGFAGQISLGQGALMLVGAYTTAILNSRYHWTIIETLPAAFVISFAIGAMLGLPALRLSGIYLALVTFAFAAAMPQLPEKYTDFFGGSTGLQFGSQTERWTYDLTWILAGTLFIAVWLLLRGRTGRAFRAIRDSEIAATSSGVSLPIYKVLAFAISGGIAGIAGSMFATVTNSFVTTGPYGVLLSLTILIGAAVAGLGSLWGMLLGAMFIGILPDLSTSVPVIGNAHGRDIVFSVVVILFVFLAPNGFAGLLRSALLRATRSQRAAPAPPSTTPPNTAPGPPPAAAVDAT